MKKIVSTLCICFSIYIVNAQYDPTIWQVADSTVNVQSITGLVPSNHYDETIPMLYVGSSDYELTWINDILQVDFLNPVGEGWADFGFLFWYPEGTSTNYFTKNINGVDQEYAIIKGYSIDFTQPSNRTVSFKYQSDKNFNLRIDLKDIAGKMTNASYPEMNLDLVSTSTTVDLNNESLWKTVTYSWGGDINADIYTNNLGDMFSGAWLGVSTSGKRDEINLIDSTSITGISFFIDDANKGIDGEQKTIYIKDLQIGNATPDTFDLSVINPPYVMVQDDSLQISNPSQIIPITIASNSEWAISGIEPWFTVSESSGFGNQTIQIFIGDTITESKQANLIITSLNGNNDTINIMIEKNICSSSYPNTKIIGDGNVCINDSKLYTLATLNLSNFDWEVTGNNNLITPTLPKSNCHIEWLEVGIDTIYIHESTWDGCFGEDSLIVNIGLCNTELYDNSKNSIEYSQQNSQIRYVGLESNVEFVLRDISGKLILTKQIQSNESMYIDTLPNGLYFVEIKTSSGRIKKEIIKK